MQWVRDTHVEAKCILVLAIVFTVQFCSNFDVLIISEAERLFMCGLTGLLVGAVTVERVAYLARGSGSTAEDVTRGRAP